MSFAKLNCQNIIKLSKSGGVQVVNEAEHFSKIMNKNNENETKSDKRHVCQTCGSSFNRPYRLTQHLLLHQNIKIFQCGEEGCNKSYTSKSHLDRHLYSVHIKTDFDTIHRCPECMKTFSNRQNLKRHLKIKHMNKTTFKCDVCRADFKKKHLLSSHMYSHTLVKPFSCDLCSKEFVSLLEKKKHMKYHKTYNCESCDMAFDQWSKYQKHKKSDHNVKEYICNDCGRKFKQREHMVRHVKTHMAATPKPVQYVCWFEDCNRIYSRHSNLKQHIKMKHLQLTHICEICEAKLSSMATLKRHLKTHCKPDELSSKHIEIRKYPKTKETGRKDRKDKGMFKESTACKIAGLNSETNSETINKSLQNENMPKTQEYNVQMPIVSENEKNGPENEVDVKQNTMVQISFEPITETNMIRIKTDKKVSEPLNSAVITIN